MIHRHADRFSIWLLLAPAALLCACCGGKPGLEIGQEGGWCAMANAAIRSGEPGGRNRIMVKALRSELAIVGDNLFIQVEWIERNDTAASHIPSWKEKRLAISEDGDDWENPSDFLASYAPVRGQGAGPVEPGEESTPLSAVYMPRLNELAGDLRLMEREGKHWDWRTVPLYWGAPLRGSDVFAFDCLIRLSPRDKRPTSITLN